jgi:hypothetical protein
MMMFPMLKLKTFQCILLVVTLLLSLQVFASKSKDSANINQDADNFLTSHSDFQFTFLLPIVEDQIQLKITIPKTFKALESNPNARLLEFIPKTDQDPYKWSEIISITKILGKGVTSSDYIETLDQLFMESGIENAKIIEKNKQSFDHYQSASSIVQYRSKERDEVVIFYSVSGPLDIANVQYALPLSSPDKLNKTVQKLKEFIKTHVEVIHNEKNNNPRS